MKTLIVMMLTLGTFCNAFAQEERWQCNIFINKYHGTKHGKNEVWDWHLRKKGVSIKEALYRIEKFFKSTDYICRIEDVLNDDSIKAMPQLPQQLGWLIKDPKKKRTEPNWVFLDDQSVTNYFGTFQELSEENPYPTPVSLCFYICSPAMSKFEFLGFGY